MELLEDVEGETLDAIPKNAEPGSLHGSQPKRRHGIDAICTNELQVGRQLAPPLRLRDRFTKGQYSLILAKHENVVLKDDGPHAGVRGDDTAEHLHAIHYVKTGNLRPATLRRMEEIC